MKKIECGQCGGNSIRTTWKEHAFDYGNGSEKVQLQARIPVRTCDDCHFSFTDAEAEEILHDAVCRHIGVLTPKEVYSIRQRYNLTRQEFAEASTIGEASLARWESGALLQNAANDSLLFLLSIPANLDRLRHRDRHAPIQLIQRASEARAPESKFQMLTRSEIESGLVAAGQFKL